MSLVATDLRVVRGGRALLDDVGLAVHPGQVLAVVGPNGAGKSTLLRCLSGELVADAGQVALDGRSLGQWSARELARRRAVLPQSSDLGFAFSVAEIVRLGRFPHEDSPGEDLRIVGQVLDAVGCTHLAARRWTTLSGGERQRVQLARVLAQIWEAGERVLLLDEPTNHLDLTHQIHVLEVARHMASRGVAVLAVLHDLGLASTHADQVAVLAAGRVVAAGRPADVLTVQRVRDVFGLDVHRIDHPDGGAPVLIPRLRRPSTHLKETPCAS